MRGRHAIAVGYTRVLCWGALSACSHAPLLSARIDSLDEVAAQAEAQGAKTCAPRELATARAHLHFARVELAQGDQTRAAEHLILAEPNARAAGTLSPAERCATPPDRDGDGVADRDDACPDEPVLMETRDELPGCPMSIEAAVEKEPVGPRSGGPIGEHADGVPPDGKAGPAAP